MDAKTILVTGIGGNVGQGILRNLISSGYPIRLIGTNISSFTAGNHWVDKFYLLPFAYDINYIQAVKEIVEKENVDLIIPSTDYESYHLAQRQEEIGCLLAASDPDVCEIYLDKYLTYKQHLNYNIPFAKSCLPSEFSNQYIKALAKPRKGRGSRGLLFNVKDTTALSDTEYVVQEQVEGREITTAVYRRYHDSKIHGVITMERLLDNGATVYCKVIKEYDEVLKAIAQQMCASLPGLKGSFNIQSIVTKEQTIVPFEINCRISGTNSIRAGFGFEDVLYTVEELLWNIKPSTIKLTQGMAYRYLSDVIYPSVNGLKGDKTDNFIEF